MVNANVRLPYTFVGSASSTTDSTACAGPCRLEGSTWTVKGTVRAPALARSTTPGRTVATVPGSNCPRTSRTRGVPPELFVSTIWLFRPPPGGTSPDGWPNATCTGGRPRCTAPLAGSCTGSRPAPDTRPTNSRLPVAVDGMVNCAAYSPSCAVRSGARPSSLASTSIGENPAPVSRAMTRTPLSARDR